MPIFRATRSNPRTTTSPSSAGKAAKLPVIKTVNLVIQEAIKRRASDIHFEPRANHLEVRYRIDGALQHMRNLPKQIQPAVISRLKIMANLDIAEKRRPQDGRIAVHLPDRIIDLRISTLPVQHGERLVARILDKSGQGFLTGQDRLCRGRSEYLRRPHHKAARHNIGHWVPRAVERRQLYTPPSATSTPQTRIL